MEHLNSEQLRESLEEILQLSVRTARDLQRTLDQLASRRPISKGAEHSEVTPDEGKIKDPLA